MTREKALEAALQKAFVAVTASYQEADAEHRGHDRIADRNDKLVKDWERQAREALALPPPEAGAEPTPVAWLCNGSGDDWEERDKIIWDKASADELSKRPDSWSVQPLYTADALASARAAGAAEAEKRIVEWLRTKVDTRLGATLFMEQLADAIERGEHK